VLGARARQGKRPLSDVSVRLDLSAFDLIENVVERLRGGCHHRARWRKRRSRQCLVRSYPIDATHARHAINRFDENEGASPT
jgi:hypothetical protein